MGDKPLSVLGWPAKTLLGAITPKPPKITPPAAMPDPLDQAAARRRTAAAASQRSGRESTIMSGDTLGPS